MNDRAAHTLAELVAHAHNAPRLGTARRVTVSFSSGGLAFAAKGQPHALRETQARLSPAVQEITVDGAHPRPWLVEVTSSDDLRRRLDGLRRGTRRLRWGPEDLGVFAAAALWTYITIPALLGGAARLERLTDQGSTRRLRVELPPHVAGHGHRQTLHVNEDGLIVRHDYTATAFGGWARASQRVDDYRPFGGVPIATRRRVTPRLGVRWPAPVLVWIEIRDVEIE